MSEDHPLWSSASGHDLHIYVIYDKSLCSFFINYENLSTASSRNPL